MKQAFSKNAKNLKIQGVLHCKECGAQLSKPEQCQGDTKPLCTPCKTHNMTVAVLKYPICGAGEE